MKKGVWVGFGTLLVVAIGVGYAPDLMLATTMRAVWAEGLLNLPPAPKPPAKDDARLAFEAAARKYADGANLLNNDFKGQTLKPAPHVVKYLDAMAAAARLPACSPISDGYDPRAYGRSSLDLVFSAARGLVARAKAEDDLLAAARIARHLGETYSVVEPGDRAVVAISALDRAAKLNLTPNDRRRIADAFGPPVSARETLRRHVAAVVARMESRTKEEGPRAIRTRQQGAYVRFWRRFFHDAPKDAAGFLFSMRRADAEIERAENEGERYVNLAEVVGTVPQPWAAWAEKIERANARLKGGR